MTDMRAISFMDIGRLSPCEVLGYDVAFGFVL